MRGYRAGDNPARWRGHLANCAGALEGKTGRAPRGLALCRGAGFLAALREQAGVAARALEFTILTAAQDGRGIGASWAEIDLPDKVWIVPGPRMKGGNGTPSATVCAAIAILREIRPSPTTDEATLFSRRKPGKPLTNMAMLMPCGAWVARI